MRPLFALLVAGALALPAAAQCEVDAFETGNFWEWPVRVQRTGARIALGGEGNLVHLLEPGADGWARAATIEVPELFLLFDPRVALSAERLAVGMVEGGDDWSLTGSVWVYEAADGWSTPTRILSPAPQIWDAFGGALALQGDTLVVGAPQILFYPAEEAERAFVYEYDGGGWRCVAALRSDTSVSMYSRFGSVIALDGETIAVAAPDESPGGPVTPRGAVYVYERGARGWATVAKLEPPPDANEGRFGGTLALSGDVLAVGSRLGRTAVHLYQRDAQGWRPVQVLERPANSSGTSFACALALDGGRLAVGDASLVDGTGLSVGGVVVYERAGERWHEVTQLVAEGADEYSAYGLGVDLDGNQVLWSGGKPTYELRLTSLGVARAEVTCAARPNSSGAAATLALEGCDSRIANELALALSGAPPGEPVWFLGAHAGAQTPFGNGTLCLAAPVLRLGGGTLDASGALAFDVDFTQPSLSSFVAGDALHLQAVFRDTGFGGGAGTSDAVALELQP